MSIIDTLKNAFNQGDKKKSNLTTFYSSVSQDLLLEERLDTKKARNIYNNVEKDYKLSAAVVICGINALIDYSGTPQVVERNKKNDILDELQSGIEDIVSTIHKKLFIEGNFFVWSSWSSKKNKIEHIFYNFEEMDNIVLDVDTHELKEISFKKEVHFKNRKRQQRTCTRTITFNENYVITEFTGDIPEGKKRKTIIRHGYSRIPIVYYTYNKMKDEVCGHGLIEPAEPYLRVLSDIMLNRAIEDRRTSRKKLNVTSSDSERWLEDTLAANGIADTGGSVDIEQLDILFNNISQSGQKGETSYLVHGQSATDSLEIAKQNFSSIIQVMGTPEWIFPSKLGASFASVAAQVPSWVHHISNIRNKELTPLWTEQILLDAEILCKATMKKIPDVKIRWKRLDLETPELRSKIVLYMMQSMKIAKESALMSDKEIRDYLDEYLNQLDDFEELDISKMIKGVKDLFEARSASDAENDRDSEAGEVDETEEKKA